MLPAGRLVPGVQPAQGIVAGGERQDGSAGQASALSDAASVEGLVTPDVDGLMADEIVSPDGELYMRRHYLHQAPGFTVRYHHIATSDPGRDLHDHPWDFVSLLLSGAYCETTADGAERIWRAGDVVVRKAEAAHRLDLLDGPMWTYVTTGPVRRRWGFHTEQGWVHWSRYLAAGVAVPSRSW